MSLRQYLGKSGQAPGPGLSLEQLLEQFQQIEQYTFLYPPQGDKGPNRVATILSKQTLVQQRLAQELGLDQLCSTQVGNTPRSLQTASKSIAYRPTPRLRSKLPLGRDVSDAPRTGGDRDERD